jgi:hypothetical protein
MSKYKVKPTPKRQSLTAQDIKDEKKFLVTASIVAVAAIVIIYLVYNYLV